VSRSSSLTCCGFADHQRQQVGVREVAVVVRVFLAAHRARLVAVGVVQAVSCTTVPPSSISSIWRSPRSRSPSRGSGTS
jgi:hypothetical protein